MKKIFAMVGAAVLCTSCVFSGNGWKHVDRNNGKGVECKGPVVVRTMDLGGFDEIVVNGMSDMELVQGDICQVVVKANEEVFNHLDYKVEDGALMLDTKDQVIVRAEEFDVRITLPLLKSLTVNGAADVDLKGGYSAADSLRVEINGAGDFDFSGIKVPFLRFELNGAGDIDASGLDVGELSMEVNGAGDVDVSGKAVTASFSVSGVGAINARGLQAEHVTTQKDGIGWIRLKK